MCASPVKFLTAAPARRPVAQVAEAAAVVAEGDGSGGVATLVRADTAVIDMEIVRGGSSLSLQQQQQQTARDAVHMFRSRGMGRQIPLSLMQLALPTEPASSGAEITPDTEATALSVPQDYSALAPLGLRAALSPVPAADRACHPAHYPPPSARSPRRDPAAAAGRACRVGPRVLGRRPGRHRRAPASEHPPPAAAGARGLQRRLPQPLTTFHTERHPEPALPSLLPRLPRPRAPRRASS